MGFNFTMHPGKSLQKKYVNNAQFEPLVTIVTPFYNAGKYFEETFNCVINQTFPWFEWIIVNDGSTNPNDLSLLECFCKKDVRIKCIHKTNGGIASARNFGIEQSITEFIIPLDADDLISPVYLEINYWSLYFNPKATWSFTDSVGFGHQEYLWRKSFSSEVMKVNNILTCTAMIRKDMFKKVGYYSEIDKHFNEDWHAWLKLLSKSYFPIHICGYHFWYRRTDTGVLSHVRGSKNIQAKSTKSIKNVAKHVKNDITSVRYPVASPINILKKPQRTNWKETTDSNTSSKSKILMVIPWLELGGADAFNLSVVRYAKQMSLDIGIITTNYNENSWKQYFENYVLDIFELPNFLSVENYAEFISYYIVSRNVKTIMISNSYYGYYMIPWLRKEFPDLTIVDYVHMEEWYWRSGGYARNSGVFGKLINKTYVCNANTKSVLVKKMGRDEDSINVAYIGVDSIKYDSNKTKAGTIKAELKLGKRKVILFPCRLDPQKRPYLMIEIISLLKHQLPDIAVIVVGDGPLLAELKIEVKKRQLQNTIYFVGRQHDLRPFYMDSDVTLICSLKEGLALTAYESCSMGVPVISSDVGGQRELIDEKVGAIIPCLQAETDYDINHYDEKEIQCYINEILKLLNHPVYYKQISANCRMRIEKSFDNAHTIPLFLTSVLETAKTNTTCHETYNKVNIYSQLADDYLTIYNEIENYVNSYNYGIDKADKRELMRILNSSWGQQILKVAFKLKLNKLFK